jgi:hypothetical protein
MMERGLGGEVKLSPYRHPSSAFRPENLLKVLKSLSIVERDLG